jgi:TetR/AcrR family transcriptional regulator, repressor of fatR-cypB operon
MNDLLSQETSSRKERERRLRQQEILKAARELFVTKGFRDTTLDEIAHHAEFGKGTLYNYFASKEDIFFGIVEQATNDYLSVARDCMAAPGSLKERLLLYAQRFILYVRDNGELIHSIYHELRRSDNPATTTKLRELMKRARSVSDILAAHLREEIGEGAVRSGDPVQLVILFDGMLRGYCMHRFVLDRRRSDDDFTPAAELITSVFLEGIVEKKGRG